MAHKKKSATPRKSWTPFYERKTKNLQEKKESIWKKHKAKLED